MTSKDTVQDFLAQKKIAVVGVSRSGKGFGNSAAAELKAKGYCVYQVNPNAQTIDGEQCYPSLSALPERADSVLIVVPPDETDQVVRDAFKAGIRNVWMQQGAESDAAIRFCKEHEMSVVHGECVLMFAEPAHWFHRTHRFVNGLVGKLPK
jgi:predicted CoA-binding protein